MKYKYTIAYLFTAASVIIYSKYSLSVIPLFLFLFLRQAIATLLLSIKNPTDVFREYTTISKQSKRNLWIFLTIRISNIALAYYCISVLSANIFGSLESPTALLVTVILGVIFLGESKEIRRLLSVAIVLVGVILVVYTNITDSDSLTTMLVFINGLFLWICNIYNKKLSDEVSTTMIVKSVFVVSVVAFFIVVLFNGDIHKIGDLRTEDWVSIIILSLGTIGTNYLYSKSIQAAGITPSAMMASLIAPLTVVLAYIFLGESMYLIQIIGLIISLLGVLWFTLIGR